MYLCGVCTVLGVFVCDVMSCDDVWCIYLWSVSFLFLFLFVCVVLCPVSASQLGVPGRRPTSASQIDPGEGVPNGLFIKVSSRGGTPGSASQLQGGIYGGGI